MQQQSIFWSKGRLVRLEKAKPDPARERAFEERYLNSFEDMRERQHA